MSVKHVPMDSTDRQLIEDIAEFARHVQDEDTRAHALDLLERFDSAPETSETLPEDC